MHHLIRIVMAACVGACIAAGSATGQAGHINLMTRNPGFEEGDGPVSRGHLPAGWERRSGPAASQQSTLGLGRDSAYALELVKTGTEFSAYHRIVNRLRGVTLDPGVPYTLEFDYYCEVVPQGDVGIAVGISATGGSGSSWDGSDDFIPDASVQFGAGNTKAGGWHTVRLPFTPTRQYHEPYLLISENYWANYPYQFRLDNFRLLVEKCTLVRDGRSDAEIVIEAGCLAMVRYAATELRDYVRKVSGAELSITEVPRDYAPPADDRYRVFVGQSAYTRQLGLDVSKLKPDGFYLYSTPSALVLVGRDEPVPYIENKTPTGRYEAGVNTELSLCATGQTGSLFAVYHFLDRYCGVRWIWPGDLGTVVPRSDTIALPVARRTVEPSFELRMYYGFNFASDPEAARWYRRAGFGSTTDPAHPNHSAHLIYGPAENHQQHPEWFALHNGRRAYADLCWTEPTLADEWVRLARDYFTKYPTATMFPIVPEDGTGICECPRCQRLVDWSPPNDGALGGNQRMGNLLFPVVNEVARRIRDEFPDKQVGTLAYSTYLKPPWLVESFEPNVAVMLCAMTPFMFDATYDQGIEAFEQTWCNKGIKVYSTWDYLNAHLFLTGNNGLYTPYIIPHLLARRYGRLKGLSRGGFYEAENGPGWNMTRLTHYGMDHLNWYVMGKLSWDPTLDVEALLDDYCQCFYGPAATPMRRFWQVQEDAWMSRKDPLVWDGVCTSRWNHVYSPRVLRELFVLLDDARRLASGASDPSYARRLDLISGEYAILRSCLVDHWQGYPADSRVPNGSFETLDGGLPAGWFFGDGASATRAETLSGAGCLQLEGSESVALSEVIALDPNKDYLVSVWFKTRGNGAPDVEAAWPKLSVLSVPEGKAPPEPNSSLHPGRVEGASEVAMSVSRPGSVGEWQRMYVVCRPGKLAQIRLRGAQGYTCYYDDVTVDELSDDYLRRAIGFPSYPD